MRVIFCLFCILPLLIAPVVEAKLPTTVFGLKQFVRVMRDVDGIPHIIAKNEHDMVLMQGWVHAQDRLFQMDFTRRQASGTLAELLGKTVLASDVEFRTLGLRRAAERSLDAASAEMKTALEAYTDGVNAYVATHPLPPEYELLNLSTFEPWTAVDSLVISKLFALSNLFGLDLELTEALFTYQTAGNALGFDGSALFFEDLFRSAPFDPASTISVATAALPLDALATAEKADKEKTAKQAAPQPETFKLIKNYLGRVRHLPVLQRAIKLGEQSQGSNEFAVSGRHTASGKPILANDPHLDLNAPSVLYQVHLKAKQAGFDVIGSGFAGVPFITIGQNEHIAWGVTSNPMDVTDFFQELVVPDSSSLSGLSTMYLNNPEPIFPVPQEFRYNPIDGGALVVAPPNETVGDVFIPDAVLIVPRRNQGPIIELDSTAGTALSVQSTGFSGTQELDAFRSINLARNLDDFTIALQSFDFGPGNFAYVDVKGNIAYFMGGEMPIREDLQAGFVDGLPPFFIRNGTGGNEWQSVETPQPGQATPFEILPFDEMPQVINPSTGYFVNANNDPVGHTLDNNALNQLRPGGGIFYLNPSFDFGTRAGRITQALEERIAAGPVTPDDMKSIQADTIMLDAQVFTPFILEAFTNAMASADPLLAALAADPRVAEVAADGGRLDSWDHSTPTGVEEGYDASDIDGQLLQPAEEEIQASVAATIYSVWRGQMIKNTIDEVLDSLGGLPRPGSRETMKALRNLLDNFDTNQGFGASGLNFFNVPGVDDPATRRDILLLKSLADALDLLAGPEFADAFGGSTDQNNYRWGRLHRLVLNHPLRSPFSIPPAGGAFPPSFPDLPGISVDGGFGVVDAASHSARADSSNDFMFDNGPVRRYVGQPSRAPRGFKAETSLPGGASGVLGNPFFDNLLDSWLTNDTYKVRHRIPDVLRDMGQKEVFKPGR